MTPEEHLEARAEQFRCDLCDQKWDRDGLSLNYLRAVVGDHLWFEHSIRRQDQGDLLPMTTGEVAWVRAQRSEGDAT